MRFIFIIIIIIIISFRLRFFYLAFSLVIVNNLVFKIVVNIFEYVLIHYLKIQ